MLLNQPGQEFEINSRKFHVGQPVWISLDDGKDLLGIIREIHTGSDTVAVPHGPEFRCDLQLLANVRSTTELLNRLYVGTDGDIAQRHLKLNGLLLAAHMIRPVRRVRLWQVNTDHILEFRALPEAALLEVYPELKYLFEGFQSIVDMGLKAPPGEVYKLVYDGMLGTDSLGDISYIFNCAHPEGYRGRSLTQSDVVELYDDSGSTYHYVDFVGYVEIPEFKPPKGAPASPTEQAGIQEHQEQKQLPPKENEND